MRAKHINESVEDVLKPKSKEDIISIINDMPADDAIKWSVIYNSIDGLRVSLKRKHDIKKLGPLLITVAGRGNYEIVKLLVDDGADTFKESIKIVQDSLVHLYTDGKYLDFGDEYKNSYMKHITEKEPQFIKIIEFLKSKQLVNEMKFSDGVEFDTSGSLRAEQRFDGWYVVGDGCLYPVDSQEEANNIINDMKARKVNEDMRFNDEGNNKAIASWTQAYVTKDFNEYTIEVEEPFSITVTGIDKDKLQYLFNKYRVRYKVRDEDELKSQN